MSQLQEAVARAIAESVGGASLTPGDDDYAAAAAAVRVVLAEAQRSVEALPLPPAQGFGGQTMRRYVLAALEQLGKDDA